ncbi:methyltransferase domain-containing protein [Candidatus Woesearchaeota archaeon]|nr:methyltransferase domain-containing protein [Candidatus Woesearchaeota archaeon]
MSDMQNSLNNNEIRPPNLMETKDKLYKEDLLLFNKSELVQVNCPACNSTDYQHYCTKMNFEWTSCIDCSTIFVNPRPTEQALETFYTSSKSMEFWDIIFRESENTRKEKIFKPRLEFVKEILKKYGVTFCPKMIDVGAGYGWFCELAKEQNLADAIVAIDPSKLFCDACKKIDGIEVIQSTIEKYKQKDANLIVNFELTSALFDPFSFIKSCYDGLAPNGIFICSTTNGLGLDLKILKDKNDSIVPHLLNLFNPNSIEILLKSIGFKNIHIFTPGLMDVNIILNKIRSGELNKDSYPFFEMLIELNNESFVSDLQQLLQKYNLSSHMVISAQK